MGKRSTGFVRRAQDAYDTPASAIEPLRPHLPKDLRYWEPCAGAGRLVEALDGCLTATDIKPRGHGFLEYFIRQRDAMDYDAEALDIAGVTHIITNPPWTRQILHPMIDRFAALRPTWLLFDADWMHTKQAIPYLSHCHRIVSVGRVSWMENGTSGKDNCAWYLFDQSAPAVTQFFGRAA